MSNIFRPKRCKCPETNTEHNFRYFRLVVFEIWSIMYSAFHVNWELIDDFSNIRGLGTEETEATHELRGLGELNPLTKLFFSHVFDDFFCHTL